MSLTHNVQISISAVAGISLYSVKGNAAIILVMYENYSLAADIRSLYVGFG